jgi:hypothetical protein
VLVGGHTHSVRFVQVMLHCCYTAVTLLLHCSYTVLTLLLHCCYSDATPLLNCYYLVVTTYYIYGRALTLGAHYPGRNEARELGAGGAVRGGGFTHGGTAARGK